MTTPYDSILKYSIMIKTKYVRVLMSSADTRGKGTWKRYPPSISSKKKLQK